MPGLFVGVGQSSSDDSFKAGSEAASIALENHKGTPEELSVTKFHNETVVLRVLGEH
jgi:hypothetical protein